MLVNLHVQDPSEYRLYEKGFFPILKRHGGEFITYDDEPQTLEGQTAPTGRIILFKFPTEEHARQWYTDPEYQNLSSHRRAATKLEYLVMIRGMHSYVKTPTDKK